MKQYVVGSIVLICILLGLVYGIQCSVKHNAVKAEYNTKVENRQWIITFRIEEIKEGARVWGPVKKKTVTADSSSDAKQQIRNEYDDQNVQIISCNKK